MSSLFPGMDPYIEAKREWPDFHADLAGEIRARLNGALQANYYATTVIHIPLVTPDPDVIPDLGAVTREVYERGAYSRRIDYAQPVPPPELTAEQQA